MHDQRQRVDGPFRFEEKVRADGRGRLAFGGYDLMAKLLPDGFVDLPGVRTAVPFRLRWGESAIAQRVQVREADAVASAVFSRVDDSIYAGPKSGSAHVCPVCILEYAEGILNRLARSHQIANILILKRFH
jgi:hypothetical protein